MKSKTKELSKETSIQSFEEIMLFFDENVEFDQKSEITQQHFLQALNIFLERKVSTSECNKALQKMKLSIKSGKIKGIRLNQ